MDLPIVNHQDYFAKIGDDHKFPINKFGELANYLISLIGLPFTQASKASII